MEGFDHYPDSSAMYEAYMRLGSIYFSWRQFYLATETQMNALKIAKAKNDSNLIGGVYHNLGSIQADLGRDQAALGYMNKSLEYFGDERSLKRASILNNIGVIYAGNSDYDSASFFYDQALALNSEFGDNNGLIYSYRNLGVVALETGSIDTAELYFSKAIERIHSIDQDPNTPNVDHMLANIYLRMSQVYAARSKPVETMEYLHRSLSMAIRYKRIDVGKQASFELARLHEERGRNDSAVYYYKLSAAYADSLWENKSDPRIDQQVFELEMSHQKELNKINEKLLQEKTHRKELRYILTVVVILSLLTGAVMLAILYRSRHKRQSLEKEKLGVEKEKLEQELSFREKELDFKKQELASHVLNLVQKNNLIEQIRQEMQQILPEADQSGYKQIKGLIQQLKMEGDKNMAGEFEKRFSEVNSEFYQRLLNKYPDLTPNEQRLCAYMYLNLSTKDICAITFQSNETIRTARSRLRKKLGIDSERNITSFLHQI
jgi:tetratricopeptide (TPR) repeat protein